MARLGHARVETLGGPTVVIEYGGLRLLTDPTFDEPGEYPTRGSYALVKTAPPSRRRDEIGEIDVVLLSHDQHPDNLDRAGRDVLPQAARVLSTGSAGERLGDVVTVLRKWQSLDIEAPEGAITVTAVPAQHGPDGSEPLVGEVTGFVLRGDDLPSIYVSGDNASLRVVREIADRAGNIDVAILFAGGASTPLIPGEYLTLTSAQAAEATEVLDVARALVVHTDGWGHFTESADDVRTAFAQAGLSDRLIGCEPGLALDL
jgi:L-ascorbate metabolism protein UlaG (beta-lactamase superfamily)